MPKYNVSSRRYVRLIM